MYLIKALSIRAWADQIGARSTLPQVIRRLVAGTVPRNRLQKLDFPAHESVQRSGFDGVVVCDEGNAWVPLGQSVWELSTEKGIKGKADDDFEKRTKETTLDQRQQMTFVFVTPRHWENKDDWVNEQLKLNVGWKGVQAYDASDLEQWLEHTVSVSIWFGNLIGDRSSGVDDVTAKWDALAGISEHRLLPDIFLAGRKESLARLEEWLDKDPAAFALACRSPSEVVDFLCAAVANLEDTKRILVEARALVVLDLPAWRQLRDSRISSILIVAPSIILDPEEIGRAVNNGHHVLLAVELRGRLQTGNQSLEVADRFLLTQALEKCGFPPAQADQHARASGGSLSVLKRRIARFPTLQIPEWGRSVSSHVAAPCLLFGGWDGANKADRQAIERMAGKPYGELEPDFQRLATCRDPLLLHAAGNWRLISKDTAWLILQDRITATSLGAFYDLATEILLDDDPKFELLGSERICAALTGHVPKYSATIKRHVAETLAFLGEFGAKLDASASVDVCGTVDRIVAAVLTQTATWHRWASLDHLLPFLAEASPGTFIRAVQADLQKPEPELVKLLPDDDDGLFSGCRHAGVLWALETLAWSPTWLPLVCQSLIDLAQDDPGGRWSNRPATSLRELLSFWMPHTAASVEDRIKALDALIQRRPEAAWDVLVKLLPERIGAVSMPTQMPMWRTWAHSWKRGASWDEGRRFLFELGKRLLVLVGANPSRWTDLIERFVEFPHKLHEELIGAAENFSGTPELTDKDRRVVADALAEQLEHVRAYSLSAEGIPEPIVDQLAALVTLFAPKNRVYRDAWLFEAWPSRHYVCRGDEPFEDIDRRLTEARDESINAIIAEDGLDGIRELAQIVRDPQTVGWFLAKNTGSQFDVEVWPSWIELGESEKAAAIGFARQRFLGEGCGWAAKMGGGVMPDSARGLLYCTLPFQEDVWGLVSETTAEAKEYYWKNCVAINVSLNGGQITVAVDHLLKHGRPGAAIELLSMSTYRDVSKEIESNVFLSAIEGLSQLDSHLVEEQFRVAGSHGIQRVVEHLQEREDVDRNRVMAIEWVYLRLLDGNGFSPRTLFNELSKNPSAFVDVLGFLRTPSGANEGEGGDANQTQRAINAHRLLRGWNVVPGVDSSGAVNAGSLRLWCDEVRLLAAEKELRDLCDRQIGAMLAKSPEDSDGTWPASGVRQVLESLLNEQIRRGFVAAVLDGRGAHFRARGGDQERTLVARFRSFGDAIRFECPQLAEVLGSIAAYYQRESENWDERDRWEE